METESWAERRRFSRRACSTPIQYRSVLKPQERFVGSLCKDLSAAGARVRVPAFLPVETRLVLLLSLPASLKPIRATARVVWTRQGRSEMFHECGLQFLEISPEDREAMAAFVEHAIPSV